MILYKKKHKSRKNISKKLFLLLVGQTITGIDNKNNCTRQKKKGKRIEKRCEIETERKRENNRWKADEVDPISKITKLNLLDSSMNIRVKVQRHVFGGVKKIEVSEVIEDVRMLGPEGQMKEEGQTEAGEEAEGEEKENSIHLELAKLRLASTIQDLDESMQQTIFAQSQDPERSKSYEKKMMIELMEILVKR